MKLIKNARISDSAKCVDILYDDKIRKIASQINQKNTEEIIELDGKLLIPGCIDAHVHFNDPGYTHHETFETGTRAAAAGGITTVIDMPCTSIPPVTSKENLQQKLAVIKKKAIIDFALWGGIRGNDLPANNKIINELWQEGVVGFKIYTISGMDTFEALSYENIESVLKLFPDLLFAFHAEDRKIIESAAGKLSVTELKQPENYLKTRPAEAEIIAVQNILRSADNNNHIHFVHMGSAEAARLILKAKLNSDVSWETCPHYLQFTAADLPELKGRLKTAPPVKSRYDREFLRQCVTQCKVDFITTDHAGCDWKSEKGLADFSQVYNGIPGTQLMIPYLFSEFYQKEKAPLSTLLKLTSENAARRYGLFPQKGSLQIDTDADFTILDMKKPMMVEESNLESIGKYSPFQGWSFTCSIAKTIVRGCTVFDQEAGILAESGYGKWLKRK